MNLDKMKNLDKEHFLDMLGLETKRSSMDVVMPALALLGVGMMVGAGFGLLLAPRTRRELREDIARRVQNAPTAVAEVPQHAADAMRRISDRGQEMFHDAVKGDAHLPAVKSHSVT